MCLYRPTILLIMHADAHKYHTASWRSISAPCIRAMLSIGDSARSCKLASPLSVWTDLNGATTKHYRFSRALLDWKGPGGRPRLRCNYNKRAVLNNFQQSSAQLNDYLIINESAILRQCFLLKAEASEISKLFALLTVGHMQLVKSVMLKFNYWFTRLLFACRCLLNTIPHNAVLRRHPDVLPWTRPRSVPQYWRPWSLEAVSRLQRLVSCLRTSWCYSYRFGLIIIII